MPVAITGATGTLRPLPTRTRARCMPARRASSHDACDSPIESVRASTVVMVPLSSATQVTGTPGSSRPDESVSCTAT